MPRVRAVRSGQTFELGRFAIRGLQGERRVRVHVPPDHDRDVLRPTLLMFDGQNVFSDEGSFAGGWHAHQAVDRLASGRVIAPLVVAIDHGHADRIYELTHVHDGRHGGGLDHLLEWVVRGLLPELHHRFKLQYGPGGHFVAGSSLGGLAALYAHFRRPDVFGGALAMSPSLWFHRANIFEFVQAQSNPYHSRVYLDCGAREGRGFMLSLAQRMAGELRSRGWSDTGSLRVMWRPDSKGTHQEVHWRRRLPKALRFLFTEHKPTR